MTSSRILDFLCQNVWALHAPVFESLVNVVRRHVAGVRLPQEEVDAIAAVRDDRPSTARPALYSRVKSVGVVPIRGVIARHASQVNGTSQPRGTSVEQMQMALSAAVADPDVSSILLDIDSPGGSVNGVDEFGAAVFEARARKPVHAIGDGMMASAAYWIGSQAQKLYATRSTAVGSIGVIATVIDEHRALANEGVDVHYITSAPAKAAGASAKPLDAADRAEIQTEVQAYHELFVDAVAKGRGVDRGQAQTWADGRVHLGREAKARGLVDEVKSFAAVIAEMDAAHGAAVSARSGDAVSAMHRAQLAEEVPIMASNTVPADATALPAPSAPAPTITKTWLEANHAGLVATWLAEGAQNERQRIAEIRELCGLGQEKIAERLIAEGRTPAEAARAFALDHKERGHARLDAMRAESAPLGQTPSQEVTVTDSAKANDPDSPEFEAQCKRQWQSDARARAFFHNDFETYVLDRKAVARGAYADPLMRN